MAYIVFTKSAKMGTKCLKDWLCHMLRGHLSDQFVKTLGVKLPPHLANALSPGNKHRDDFSYKDQLNDLERCLIPV